MIVTVEEARPGRRRRGRGALLLAAALLPAATPAGAQSAPALAAPSAAELPPDAPVRLGTLSLYPALEIGVFGVDSNVFNEAVNPKDDFSSTVNPRMIGAWELGSLLVVGAGAGNLVYYRTYKDEQSANGLVSGRVELVSTRLRPFVTAGYLRSKERTGYEIDVRARRDETAVSAGADFEVTAITWLTAWVQRNRLEYASGEQANGVQLSSQLNRTTEVAAAGAKFSLTPLTTLVVAGEIQHDRFERSPLRDADSFRLTPTFQFAPSAAISGRVGLGYRRFRPKDRNLPEYQGFVASVNAGFTVLGRTTFQVTANRDVDYSVDALTPYYVGAGGRVTVSQRIAGPFDIIGVGGWQRLSYRGVARGREIARTETTKTAGGGVGIRFNIDLRLAVTYEYTQRDSSVPGIRIYDRRRVLGVLNYGQ